MKKVISTLICALISQGAMAATRTLPLDKISCKGKNGVVIKGVLKGNLVRTELGGYKKDFELTQKPLEVSADYYKLSLGIVGSPNVSVYDMYLWGDLTRGEVSHVEGLVGQTYPGTVVPPIYPSPVPLPFAFAAITPVKCTLLTR